MSSQAITDYLTKQIFIEKNIITFRALSRHLSIHVNAAKNELATYHHNAPYQSQPCTATFMLTGVLKYKERLPTQDVDMEGSPSATQEEDDEEDDGEWAPRVTVTVVNEKDLEDAKDSYEEIHSISIYSLAPTSLHDASLLCTSIAQVRETDRAKGQAYAATVGRITTKGIKPGASKKKPQPAAPIAGPSNLNAPADAKPTAKPEAKEPEKAAADKGKEKEKDKPKQTGKLNFFSKPAESKTVVKKEESAADSKKKLFFGKPVPKKETPAPALEAKAAPSKPLIKEESPAPVEKKNKADEPKAPTVKAEEKIPPVRGVKRKSSVGLDSRERSPENPAAGAGSSKAAVNNAGVKVKRRVVLSDDDESDGAHAKPAARKSRATTRMVDSDAEREAMALMDIDDDEVERVSRVPSTTNSSRGSVQDDDDDDDEERETKAASPAALADEDVDMEDVEVPVKAKPKPRKPKAVIPVGRNGLKKRKVTKTRRTVGEDGYTRKEDYSDWESVDSDAEPAEAHVPVKAAGKAKAKAVAVKKESLSDIEDAPEKVEKAKAVPAKKAASKAATTKPKAAPKAAGSAKGKAQQQKLNFFGPKKT